LFVTSEGTHDVLREGRMNCFHMFNDQDRKLEVWLAFISQWVFSFSIPYAHSSRRTCAPARHARSRRRVSICRTTNLDSRLRGNDNQGRHPGGTPCRALTPPLEEISFLVIPAVLGGYPSAGPRTWIPAFAGMTAPDPHRIPAFAYSGAGSFAGMTTPDAMMRSENFGIGFRRLYVNDY